MMLSCLLAIRACANFMTCSASISKSTPLVETRFVMMCESNCCYATRSAWAAHILIWCWASCLVGAETARAFCNAIERSGRESSWRDSGGHENEAVVCVAAQLHRAEAMPSALLGTRR